MIYTDSLNSILAIENNRENHPILNQIYDILAEHDNQGKQNTLCKVPDNIVIKGNKKANRAAKQAIDMPGMTTTTSYRLRKQYYLHYIKSRIVDWENAHNSNTSLN